MTRRSGIVYLCGIVFSCLLTACAGSPAGNSETPGPRAVVIVYQTLQSHDGHPDPDDNLALLAGFFAIKRNAERSAGRVQQLGLVYGDTTDARHNLMLNGADSGYGNYRFFLSYSRPAVLSCGSPATFDEVNQTWSFNATNKSQITTGGQYVYDHVKAALDNHDPATFYRVVYSAGGGHNAAYEAIQLLRHDGYSDPQIKDHFAIIQHSNWNLDNCMDASVRDATLPFTIRITDQNPFSGGPNNRASAPPMPVSVTRTSAAFAHAWDVATGYNGAKPDADRPLEHFLTTLDASDAGSHSFASSPALLDANWDTRNNRNSAVSYRSYTPETMRQDMLENQN